MADPTWDDVDQLVTSDDPQADVAARGFKQLGMSAAKAALDEGKPISQAPMEGVIPEADPFTDLASGALATKAAPSVVDAIANGISHAEFGQLVGNEIGAVGRNVAPKVANYGKVTWDKGPEPTYGKVTWDKGPEPSKDYGKVIIQDTPKENIGKVYQEEGPQPKPDYGKVIIKEAEGGMVPSWNDIAEFQNSPESQPAANNSEPTPTWNDVTALADEKYGTLGQQAKAGLEGLAQGVAGPLATQAEVSLGVKPEDIRGRATQNPVTHYGSEIAGLVGPAALTGGESLLAKSTQGGLLSSIAEKLAPTAGETVASKIGSGAAKAAIDNMLLAGSDETSKMILKDPEQSAESVAATIGLSGLLGGALGGAGSGAMALWNRESGSKAGKLIEDFKARVAQHVDNPDPVSAMTKELGDYHKAVTSAADEVYGPNGIKAQDIQSLMPEMSGKILEHAQQISDKLESTISKMDEQPSIYPQRLTNKLKGDLDLYQSAVSSPQVSPGEIFNATQELKQQLQAYSKFDKFVKPTDEAYDFVKAAKTLSHDLRTSLEDHTVWGKAAKRQQVINKAFSEYLPTLKDFEKKFTIEVNGDKQIDPAKVQTYLGQLGNARAEIKQQMLKNFLEASEKYKKVLGDSHANLGIDSPFLEAPLNITKASLEEKTLGGQLADAFIHKGLTDASGTALGASIGAGLGHALGGGLLSGIGGLVGAHALGPFFKSILPAIAKSVVENPASSRGFKAATDFSANVAKSQYLISKAAKNVFKVGSEAYASNVGEKERDKLKKYIGNAQEDPNSLLDNNNHLQHYMPNHAMALNATTGNAVAYLNTLRPDTHPKNPLDSKPVPSTTDVARYNSALNIAEKPLIILNKIKEGTLTGEDIKHLGSMYPQLYRNIQNALTDEMIDHVARKQVVPYKTRIALSMFLGQPLDNTMQPQSIMSTQMLSRSVASAPQQQASPKGVKSSPALQKMPNLYETSSQARAQRAMKH